MHATATAAGKRRKARPVPAAWPDEVLENMDAAELRAAGMVLVAYVTVIDETMIVPAENAAQAVLDMAGPPRHGMNVTIRYEAMAEAQLKALPDWQG